jgi:hypothetical protein
VFLAIILPLALAAFWVDAHAVRVLRRGSRQISVPGRGNRPSTRKSPALPGSSNATFAAVDFGNPSHDGKTETASRFAGAEYSIETLPELSSLVGRDSPSFIGDGDAPR